MEFRFEKHYTVEEARALLPQVKLWLKRLLKLRTDFEKQDAQVSSLLSRGRDVGGRSVNAWVRTLSQIKEVLLDFQVRQIQIKDLDRGLIDFPSIIAGREVFLCWEQGEQDIEFWHDLDSGYAGRSPL